MRVNPAVVLLKFLPIALTLVNVASAFVFLNTCQPYLPEDSSMMMANCTRVLMVNNEKFEVKSNKIYLTNIINVEVYVSVCVKVCSTCFQLQNRFR